MSLSYAAITPVRNDPTNLYRIGICMRKQTLEPAVWVIVDDGSTDQTLEVALMLCDELSFAKVLHIPPDGRDLQDGRVQLRDKHAFELGLAYADHVNAEVIFKIDVDISFDADYCAAIVAEFEADPKLGIAGGQGYELDPH